jgi:hypothetical protein
MSDIFHKNADVAFKSVDEIKDFLSTKNRVVSTPVDNNVNFESDKDGRLHLLSTGNDLQFAQSGFNRFCKLLKVPPKYLQELPFDNIKKDLTVSMLKSNLEEMNLIVRDEKIVGVTARENVVSPLEVVDRVFKNGKELKDANISNENLTLCFVRSYENIVDNDRIGSGLCVTHDNSTGSYPSLSFYFWREVCENGAIAKNLEKMSKFSTRLDKDKMFEMLDMKIEQYTSSIENILSSSLQNMKQREVPQDEKRFLKSFLSRKLDFKNNGELEGKFDDLISKSSVSNYYDLMNYITNSSKEMTTVDSNKVKVLGGMMVAHFKSEKPSLDLFNGYAEFKRKKLYKDSI